MNVSAIVNCHREGHLAWRSFLSAYAAATKLPGPNEIILMLDAPDDETRALAKRFADEHPSLSHPVRVLEAHVRDLGEARNLAVKEARGKYVAFLDADDIWGEHWLSRAFDAAEKDGSESFVYHPQLIVNFELDTLWWQHADSRSTEFDPSVFFLTNHWTAHHFSHRSLVLREPYRTVGEGFGFEDWEWNMRTLSHGAVHAVVPETVHFIRKSNGSMSSVHASQGRTPRPNDFFERRVDVAKQEVPKLELGEWLTEEWRAAHEVEPMLWPNPREYHSRQHYSPPGSPGTYDVYHRINDVIPKDITHLIVYAGLGGGADLRVKHYADAIVAAGGKAALLATDMRSAGFDGHDTVEAATALNALSPIDRVRVMQRLMLQAMERGVLVHIVNSQVAWGAVQQNPATFASYGGVWVSLYAFEEHPHGRRGGYAANGAFGGAVKGIERVVTDNTYFKSELAERYGWTRTTMAPTPVELVDLPPKVRAPGAPLRVLWAGRVDWNKNLDRVFDIATEALTMNEGILFDVAGDSSDYAGFTALSKLRALPNVKLRGPYRKFSQLKPEQYDVFLLTSRKEGMPNTMLEAMSHGLPVVTTAAGGIIALDPSSFPGAILQSNEPKEAVAAIRAAGKGGPNPRRWLKDRHTASKFADALRQAGYFRSVMVEEKDPTRGSDPLPEARQEAAPAQL